MKFTTYTDKGGRSINEDYISSTHKNGIYCFVVADGLGPGGSGAVASELAVKTVIKEFEKSPLLTSEALHSYIEEAHRQLLIKKSEKAEYGDMAATIAVLMTDGKRAVWASCGDTRIYIYRHSRINEVTEDHSAAFEKFVKGEIDYEDIRYDADSIKLRRALGDRLAWQPQVSEVFGINSAFSFLICTDGFWRLITEQETEIARFLSSSSKGWLKKMLKKIVLRTENGCDNISAAAITMQLGDTF